jgi:hypothetical protein
VGANALSGNIGGLRDGESARDEEENELLGSHPVP